MNNDPDKPDKIVDFIILSPPRSGSTYLMNVLNSHPEITCKGELFGGHVFPYPDFNTLVRKLRCGFHPDEPVAFRFLKRCWNRVLYIPMNIMVRYRDANPVRYLRKVRSAEPDCGRYFGFKLLLFQQSGLDTLPMIMPLKILRLRRRNIVKQAISFEVAKSSNIWQKRAPRAQTPMFHILPQKVLTGIQALRDQYRCAQEIIEQPGCEYLDLVYEDFFADMPAYFQKIGAFLGVSATDFNVQNIELFKYTPRDLREVLRNFDEIYQALESEDLRLMLTDVTT